VRCGTTFHTAYVSQAWYQDGAVMTVALTVVRLVAYGRAFEWFDEGLTGAVTVSGDVPEQMDEGWVLVE
jgi:hypothetical protein